MAKYTEQERIERREARKEARKEARREEKRLAKIEAEKNQKPVESIEINILWKKSRMWGSNPLCYGQVNYIDGTCGIFDGIKASGCGYDKESTVIAEVFNTYLKYKLYNIEETKGQPYGITLRDQYKYFEGGVGTNCYYGVSEAIGGKFQHVASGKSFDVYKYITNESA